MNHSIYYDIFNFSLLIIIIYGVTRSILRPFFYGRRMATKKDMVEKAWALKKASIRFKKAKLEIDKLPEDVSKRRSAIERGMKEECEYIISKAQEAREHMLEVARQRSEKEIMQSVILLKSRIARQSIVRAREKLSAEIEKRGDGVFIEKGFEALKRGM